MWISLNNKNFSYKTEIVNIGDFDITQVKIFMQNVYENIVKTVINCILNSFKLYYKYLFFKNNRKIYYFTKLLIQLNIVINFHFSVNKFYTSKENFREKTKTEIILAASLLNSDDSITKSSYRFITVFDLATDFVTSSLDLT